MVVPPPSLVKDISTKMILGYGVKQGQLYVLEATPQGGQQLECVSATTTSQQAEDSVWLWHRRLGHLSFNYLRKLFPSLFTAFNKDVSQCNICELAKSHRISFSPSINKSVVPFQVVHSDLWGPAQVPSFS
ncbi:uncharacterized mitochondrial protein AtMg00300-like [Gastrolobium bilobum]|uniref:uncharacterized mitochondrial protein AtMg00300-like n=1 Tax=Gastrolobium bilobum TaxID=150636 RepID=UPI002AB2F3F6|nr:uncharacterized mitochondrial protein AtMg00300-like [Gastrolobium bilobum]